MATVDPDEGELVAELEMPPGLGWIKSDASFEDVTQSTAAEGTPQERASDQWNATLAAAGNSGAATDFDTSESTEVDDYRPLDHLETECARHMDPERPRFWSKDHRSACYVAEGGKYLFKACRRPGGCTVIGWYSFRTIIFAYASSYEPEADVEVSFDKWEAHGAVNPNAVMRIAVVCLDVGDTTCAPDRDAVQSYTLVSRMPSGGFRPMHVGRLDTSNSPGTDDGRHHRNDHVNYHELRVVVTGADGATWSSPVHPFRCDRAPYIDGGRGGCIFHKTAAVVHFNKKPSQPEHENVQVVAEHIDQAQRNPASTVPGGAGIKIAGGKSSGKPLTRLVNDPVYDTGGQYALNRSTAVAACVRHFGPGYATGPNGELRDCDEYPFASTFEGAYDTVLHPGSAWEFSVKALDRSQNRRAGGQLASWYDADRILHTDPFWVEIDS